MTDALDLRGEFGNTIPYTGSDVELARQMIRSYTRSVGCPPDDDADWPSDLLAVTHSVAVRLHGGDFTRSMQSLDAGSDFELRWFRPFRGFSLVERSMLHRHRQRIM